MKRSAAPVLAAIAVLLAGCQPDEQSSNGSIEASTIPATPERWFESAVAASGIDFVHQTGAPNGQYFYPESMGSGLALCDFDNDGDLDLYLVQSGSLDPSADHDAQPTNRLYINDGSGHFSDTTEQSGTGDRGYGMGANCADVDADGDIDLYVTNVGANALYLNRGDGSFANFSTESGTAHPGWSVSSTFFDADGDSDLDLFVVNYLNWTAEGELVCRATDNEREYCGPANYRAPATDALFLNQGDGRFVDVTTQAGIASTAGNGLGAVSADFNNDGHVDVYVANDQMANHLWVGDGQGNFVDQALLAGTAFNRAGQAEAGMGVVAEDMDGDSDPDLLVTHLRGESNTLYLNQLDSELPGVFEDASAIAGVGAPSVLYTGFGVGAVDFDQDGRLDLYIANGRVVRGTPVHGNDPYAEPDLVFRGVSAGKFEVIELDQNMVASGRGAAFGDLDGDLDIDVVVANRDAAPSVLLNVASSGHGISFAVKERDGTDALGAKLLLRGANDQWRYLTNGNSYASASAPRAHFGIGSAHQIETILVHWRDGEVTEFGPYEAGKHHRLQRPLQ